MMRLSGRGVARRGRALRKGSGGLRKGSGRLDTAAVVEVGARRAGRSLPKREGGNRGSAGGGLSCEGERAGAGRGRTRNPLNAEPPGVGASGEKDSVRFVPFFSLSAFFWIEYFYGSIWVFVYVSWLHLKCLIFPPGF